MNIFFAGWKQKCNTTKYLFELLLELFYSFVKENLKRKNLLQKLKNCA